jgi:hypothetical protein
MLKNTRKYLLALAASACLFGSAQAETPLKRSPVMPMTATNASVFKLSSPEMKPGQMLSASYEFAGFGCAGENLSPALQWQGAPAGTQSYAITMYDPDAPTGSGWWHWMAYNLPADTNSLPRGAGSVSAPQLPAGAVQQRIDFGVNGYGGVCPPLGSPPHRYIFTVHALKTAKLEVPADATAALAGFIINANTLAKTSFTVRYARKKSK